MQTVHIQEGESGVLSFVELEVFELMTMINSY